MSLLTLQVEIHKMNLLINDVRKKRYLLEKQLEDDNVNSSDIEEELITGYLSVYNRIIKRIIDCFIAIPLLVFLSPVFLAVSAAIVIEDGLPIFYRAERGGYKGKTFKIYKFRSMVKNADRIGGGTTELNDNRITKVGRIIRKLKIDEFPNLLCVICGTMAFCGPRPELLCYTSTYSKAEKTILEVRPGITDYSSIEFINLDEIVGSGNADKIYEEKVLPRKNKLRIKYAATVSFTTDLRLFVLTIWKVFEKAYRYLFKRNRGKI